MSYWRTWGEGLGIIIAIFGFAVVMSSLAGIVGLWALNVLGFFEPFTWKKVAAVAVLSFLLSGSVKFK